MPRKRSSYPFPTPSPLPPAPWETGAPVTVPLDVLPQWLEHHGAKVLDVRVRYERGQMVIVGYVVPQREQEDTR